MHYKKQRLVGIQGSPGAFHEEAAWQLFEGVNIVYLPTFDDLFEALYNKKIELAVAAISNVSIGFIDAPHEELVEKGGDKLWITGETYVTVEHQLLGIPSSKLSDIKYVHSMAPALQQCTHSLHALIPGVTIIEEEDTAISAEIVHELNDIAHAAIASKRAGELNSLVVLQSNVQDKIKNVTRFLSLARREYRESCLNGEEDKTTILLDIPDKAGSLHLASKPFFETNTNISILHSSFVPDSNFTERFYLEFDAGINSDQGKRILNELDHLGCGVTILGSYKAQLLPDVK